LNTNYKKSKIAIIKNKKLNLWKKVF